MPSDRLSSKPAIVVTSIHLPTPALTQLAQGAALHEYKLTVVGDAETPEHFDLAGSHYFSVDDQLQSHWLYARRAPLRSYARKNIGYLWAMEQKAAMIIDTDDDNAPLESFWVPRERIRHAPEVAGESLINIYRYFTEDVLWPRGLPLDAVHQEIPSWESLPVAFGDCPIQQGLVDHHPDVDAVYWLTMPMPKYFRTNRSVILGARTWCPFNSQNTVWWPDAYPLLYLPGTCSFRLSDIWRSFVAQRIAWANSWNIFFHGPTMRHERNKHDLRSDLAQELPGYLFNRKICEALEKLELKPGLNRLGDHLRLCYERLIALCLFERQELNLLEAWLQDLEEASRASLRESVHIAGRKGV